MKKLRIILMIIIALLFSEFVTAQMNVNINVGPRTARYYYLPNIHAYYDIQKSKYIYLSGSRWIHAKYLPESYGRYNLKSRHKVIIKDYRGDRPFVYIRKHKAKFPKGYGSSARKSKWSASSKNNKARVNQNIQTRQNYKRDKQSNFNGGNKGNNSGKGNGKRK